MTNKKLKEFINFIPGINQSRSENQLLYQEIEYYDQSAFESDFYFQSDIEEKWTVDKTWSRPYLRAGDVVISSTKQVAAIVGKENANKILPINFINVEFLNEELDRRYFLFLFNLFKDVQRQKERETQGTGLIHKIPLRSLGEIQIPYITMEQQKLVGNSYIEMIEIQNKLKKYSELSESLLCAILEKTI